MRSARMALGNQKSRQRSATHFILTTPLQLAFQESADMSASLPRNMKYQAIRLGQPSPPV